MSTAVELLLAKRHRVVARVEEPVDLSGLPATMDHLSIVEITEVQTPPTRPLTDRANALLRGFRSRVELGVIDASWGR